MDIIIISSLPTFKQVLQYLPISTQRRVSCDENYLISEFAKCDTLVTFIINQILIKWYFGIYCSISGFPFFRNGFWKVGNCELAACTITGVGNPRLL